VAGPNQGWKAPPPPPGPPARAKNRTAGYVLLAIGVVVLLVGVLRIAGADSSYQAGQATANAVLGLIGVVAGAAMVRGPRK
jgi:uncharacterized membrane protein HdeD (DUF308 family)